MSELSTDARTLFEAARGEDQPAPADKARIRSRLAAELGAGVFASAATLGVASSPRTPDLAHAVGSALWRKLALKTLAVAGAAGLVYAAVQLAPRESRNPVPAARPEPVADSLPSVAVLPATPAVETTLPSAETAVPSAHERAPEPAVARVQRARRAPRAPSPEPASCDGKPCAPAASVDPVSLQAQTASLRRAMQALQARDVPEALRVVASYRAAFPGGMLRVEHEGVEALAHCLAGESSHPTVRAFMRPENPSPMKRRVHDECKLP